MADSTAQTQDLTSQQTTGTDINLNLNFDDLSIPETEKSEVKIDFSDIPQTPETNVNVEALPDEETSPASAVATPAVEATTPEIKAEEIAPVVEEAKTTTEVNPTSAVVKSEEQKSSDII